jgi:hypothetical protein
MKSLNEFKSNIEKLGTVHQNRFDVEIPGPYFKDLALRCESVNIPGIQILTTDFKLFGGQPIVKIPNARSNDEVQMTFLASGDMRDKYFFEEWLHKISDFETNNVAYYKDVAKDILITVYNEKELTKEVADTTVTPEGGERQENPGTEKPFKYGGIGLSPIYTAKLVNAIPNRIEMIQVSWADVDQLLKYSVNFSYESLEIVGSSNKSNISFSHLDKVQK